MYKPNNSITSVSTGLKWLISMNIVYIPSVISENTTLKKNTVPKYKLVRCLSRDTSRIAYVASPRSQNIPKTPTSDVAEDIIP